MDLIANDNSFIQCSNLSHGKKVTIIDTGFHKLKKLPRGKQLGQLRLTD